MKAQSTIATLIVPLLTSAAALAHPGHGTTDPEGLVHYVTEPVHALALAAAACVAAAAALWRGRGRRVRDDASDDARSNRY